MDFGGCDVGSLANGVQLPENPALYTVWRPENAWGTADLVDVLISVSEEMAWRVPGAEPLMIGDMSNEGGGWMRGHRSHRGGLDADVGIYHGDAQQYDYGLRTVPVDQLDLDTNLEFVLALFATDKVERILLDRRLIRALRTHAVQSERLSAEDAAAMFILPEDNLEDSPFSMERVVHHVPGHHHHFHVRVYCGD